MENSNNSDNSDNSDSSDSSGSSLNSFTMHMCSNNSEKENRQHQIQIHKNMEKNIVYQLVENTVTLQKLKEELFHLKTLISKAFIKYNNSELDFTLPIKCIDDLTSFEDSYEKWSNPMTKALLKIFRKELQKNIENRYETLGESIQRLLQKLFDDSFVIYCYWRKRSHPTEKYKLKYSLIIACIYISLEKIWPDFTEPQFEYVINNWLENTKIKFITQ